MSYREYLGGSFNEETQEFDKEIAKKEVYKRKSKLNIVLFGATGVGKSSLVNAVFGEKIVKSGDGEPVTQFLEKIEIPSKGLTLWDTKGIEAKDYENTRGMLTKDIRKGFKDAFDSNNDDEAPHVAWLCIKESSRRVEEREHDLINIAKEFGIPTVVVFTDMEDEKGIGFFEMAKKKIDEQHKDFVKDRYVRVNSVSYTFKGMTIPTCGLEELINWTEDCFTEGQENTKKQRQKYIEALRKAQEVDMQKKLNAMIESARKKVHFASAAAATVGASPIPGSDAPLIAAVQSKLIYALNSEFEVDEDNNKAVTMITGVLGATAIAQVGKAIVSNALKFIPVVGTLVGGAISASTAAVLTQAVGHAYIRVLVAYFDKETGKTILPEQTSAALAMFKDVFVKMPKK
ncbi:YcjF family protein [Psychrobacter urativorans]|uniref:YcjF family protein n=1 Tax=Psychrobacter urativorans TaxID=45610 RepID=UPI001917BE1A|nr:GTPase [Psychrobacter urativorans]